MLNKAGALKLFALIFIMFMARPFTMAARAESRTIELAGLVVDAQSLQPVAIAKIYDEASHLLGATDKNGYYKITINYEKAGALKFKLKITAAGFSAFSDTENWADLSGGARNIMYFGLQRSGSHAESFSLFSKEQNISDLSYNAALKGFGNVREQKAFDNKLTAAKAGNDDVVVKVDNEDYLVNNTGWIKLKSLGELVSVDNKKTLPASQLNSLVKRKAVKSMTPVSGRKEQYAIFTR